MVRKVCFFGQSKRFCRDTFVTEEAPRADTEIDRKKTDGNYVLTDEERKDSGKQMVMLT